MKYHPKSNANYGLDFEYGFQTLWKWPLHVLYLPMGALFRRWAEEYKNSQKLIENNLGGKPLFHLFQENTFTPQHISVKHFGFLNKNKKGKEQLRKTTKTWNYRYREEEILFMDLDVGESEYEKKYVELTEKRYWKKLLLNLPQLANKPIIKKTTYKGHARVLQILPVWRCRNQRFVLVPSKYIEFVDKNSGIDLIPKFETDSKGISNYAIKRRRKNSQKTNLI